MSQFEITACKLYKKLIYKYTFFLLTHTYINTYFFLDILQYGLVLLVLIEFQVIPKDGWVSTLMLFLKEKKIKLEKEF